MSWGGRFLAWLAAYHVGLIARTEAHDPLTRFGAVDVVMFPWIVPMVVGGVLCLGLGFLLNLNEMQKGLILAPFAIISMGGVTYAGAVFIYYGIKADIRRWRETGTSRIRD